MPLFNVYPLYNVTPVSAKGVYVYDENNTEYLDLYGGHAVISIGHGHPKYIEAITNQVRTLGFYSNAIQNPLQIELANKLEALSGCKDYELFLCSSGAEANENALKLASFKTEKSRVIAFKNGFHGRTSAAVAVTDNKNIIAPINAQQKVTILDLNDIESAKRELEKGDVCAVIVEFIQGVGGLDQANGTFFEELDLLCKANNSLFIADEVQSGYGRSGKFFAFQHYKVTPDIISIAKGMGNGFPIGGILIHPSIKAKFGMLGTTFGGNHLACAAGLSVLNVIEEEHLMDNVNEMAAYFIKNAKTIPQVKQIKGKGLMLGLEFDFEVSELRKKLIYEHHIFTGGAANKKGPKNITALKRSKEHIDQFFEALVLALKKLIRLKLKELQKMKTAIISMPKNISYTMQKKKRILLKVGSNTLTKETNNISRGKIEDIANQIAKLKDTCEFIIVSSGAIAVAKQFVKLESKESAVFVKQALASIGQPHLIRIYQEIFREYGLLSSQCLLSYSDFEKQQSKTNIVNTINVLVQNNYIPIINENDTVATDEIQFGDNDKLAALTAVLLDVDLLIIATNTYGIYTKESFKNKAPKTIEEVHSLEDLKREVIHSTSSHGSGGMASKIEAAEISKNANIETWIVNGIEDHFITSAFENKVPFTKINNNKGFYNNKG